MLPENFNWFTGFIFPYLNFVMFVGIIAYFGLPKIREMLTQKRNEFVLASKVAKDAENKAKSENEALKRKLANFDEEVRAVVESATKAAKIEEERIEKSARDLVQYVREEVQSIAAAERNNAKNQLEEELLRMVREQAYTKVRSELTSSEKQTSVVEKKLKLIQGIGAVNGV